eukprot:121858_1
MSSKMLNIYTKIDVSHRLQHDYLLPSKPIQHPRDHDTIIYSTNWYETDKYIYEYNLKGNNKKQICKINKQIATINNGLFMDTDNEILYMFGNDVLAWVDLKSEQLKINNKKTSLVGCNTFPMAAYIPAPVHQCHILSNAG